MSTLQREMVSPAQAAMAPEVTAGMAPGERRFLALAGWLAIAALPLAVVSTVTYLVALDFDADAMSDPARTLEKAVGQGEWVRMSYVTDVLGYYLLRAALVIALWRLLRPRSPDLVTLFTAAGLAFIVIGAAGAGTLSIATTDAIDAYAAAATGEAREIQEALFIATNNAGMLGTWATVNALLAGVWMTGIGWFYREQRRLLGWSTVLLGTVLLLGWAATVANRDAGEVPSMVYFFLSPIVITWMGVDLLRRARSTAAE